MKKLKKCWLTTSFLLALCSFMPLSAQVSIPRIENGESFGVVRGKINDAMTQIEINNTLLTSGQSELTGSSVRIFNITAAVTTASPDLNGYVFYDTGVDVNGENVYNDISDTYAYWYDSSQWLVSTINDVDGTPTDYFNLTGNGAWTGAIDSMDTLDYTVEDEIAGIRSKTDLLTVTSGIDLDYITVTEAIDLDYITVTAATDLDDIRGKVGNITVTQAANLDTINTKVGYLTVTDTIDLDTMDDDVTASKTITDKLTVPVAVDLTPKTVPVFEFDLIYYNPTYGDFEIGTEIELKAAYKNNFQVPANHLYWGDTLFHDDPTYPAFLKSDPAMKVYYCRMTGDGHTRNYQVFTTDTPGTYLTDVIGESGVVAKVLVTPSGVDNNGDDYTWMYEGNEDIVWSWRPRGAVSSGPMNGADFTWYPCVPKMWRSADFYLTP